MPSAFYYHEPVLLKEILNLLVSPEFGPHPRILDCTLGGGGHTEAFLKAGATVVGIDRDPEAIRVAGERLTSYPNFKTVQANYSDVADISELEDQTFTGILADLGVSSRQLDETSRGFSFREDAPLDMRMEGGVAERGAGRSMSYGLSPAPLSATPSAADLLNSWKEEDLARIFKEFGDEPKARKLAREILRRRERQSFETSTDLVGAIRAVLGPRSAEGDFARLFQAVRIAVNDELAGLEKALPALRNKLSPGGVLAVISYHSGEDRIVKHAMREWSADCICPPKQLHCTCRGKRLGELITRKAETASDEEIARNPRARSARLRAWRKEV